MRYAIVTTLLSVAFLSSAVAQPTETPKDVKEIKIYCPVVGLPGLKSDCGCPSGYCSLKPKDKLAIEYKGAKLRFCCGSCVKIFQAEPAKFAATANHQLVATKQAKQTKCPNCGGDCSTGTAIEVGGVAVNFCADCARKAKAGNAEGLINMTFGEKAFGRGFVVGVEKK